jgi:hypothetical protein
MIATNKQYSYLRVAVIRIDVHPAWENPINTPHAFHARFTYGPGPYISHDSCRQPFASPHNDETGPYTREKYWRSKTDKLSHHLGSPHSLTLMTALEWGREVSAKWLYSYISLLGP